MKRRHELFIDKTAPCPLKKNWIIFVLQMLFLIFSFLLILWGQKKLKSFSQEKGGSPIILERKAGFILPQKK